MAVDFKVDSDTLDLVPTPSGDFFIVSGVEEVEQRMRMHLRIPLGSYALAPTIGSTLSNLLRSSTSAALAGVPLSAKEALAQMDDIQVADVVASIDADDPRKINFVVSYSIVSDGVVGDTNFFNDSITVGG